MSNPLKYGIIALPLLLSCLPQAVQAATQNGTILIRNKDYEQCSLTVPGEGSGKLTQYEFNLPDSSCKNIKPRTIQFDGLPSAATILITDGLGCDLEDAKFRLKLRTTRRVTSMPAFEFEDLVSFENHIAPGVLVLEKDFTQDSDARDSTACIRITTSPATKRPDPIPATQVKEAAYFVDPRERFTCGLHEVITARLHRGDETDGRTAYICATFKQASTDLLIGPLSWSNKIIESSGTYYMCPPGKVMVGRDHWNDENGSTTYACASLKNGSKDLEIIWSDGWSAPQGEHESGFACPTDSFLVGRYHDGDEEGPTRYRCATAQ